MRLQLLLKFSVTVFLGCVIAVVESSVEETPCEAELKSKDTEIGYIIPPRNNTHRTCRWTITPVNDDHRIFVAIDSKTNAISCSSNDYILQFFQSESGVTSTRDTINLCNFSLENNGTYVSEGNTLTIEFVTDNKIQFNFRIAYFSFNPGDCGGRKAPATAVFWTQSLQEFSRVNCEMTIKARVRDHGIAITLLFANFHNNTDMSSCELAIYDGQTNDSKELLCLNSFERVSTGAISVFSSGSYLTIRFPSLDARNVGAFMVYRSFVLADSSSVGTFCKNGILNNRKNQCDCNAGWTGVSCGDDIKECKLDENPCQHGGNCTEEKGSYSCSCPAEFTGKQCETDVNECNNTVNPCKNGGRCINTYGGLECVCKPGFTNTDCSEEKDLCRDNNPCNNGGSCHSNDGRLICTCVGGWTGLFCDTDPPKMPEASTLEQSQYSRTDIVLAIVLSFIAGAVVVTLVGCLILLKRSRKACFKQKMEKGDTEISFVANGVQTTDVNLDNGAHLSTVNSTNAIRSFTNMPERAPEQKVQTTYHQLDRGCDPAPEEHIYHALDESRRSGNPDLFERVRESQISEAGEFQGVHNENYLPEDRTTSSASGTTADDQQKQNLSEEPPYFILDKAV